LEIAEQIYFTLRRSIDFRNNVHIRREFQPLRVAQDILSGIDPGQVIERKKKFLQNLNIDGRKESNINEDLARLLEYAVITDEKEFKKRALKKALFSEFNNDISNRFSSKDTVIEGFEYRNQLFSITINKNNIKNFEIIDELSIKDATLIETPMILQYNEMIDCAKCYFYERNKERPGIIVRPDVSLHTKDLLNKLKEAQYFDVLNDDMFYDVISGSFTYHSSSKTFYLQRGNEEFKAINIASGIKSFGILQLLYRGGYLSVGHLLIIDEPEVHLHPEWQIEYARIIIQLIQKGVTVIINTHSPYIVDALKYYAGEAEVNHSFYLAHRDNNHSMIIDVTNDISPIFEKLAEPLDKLHKLKLGLGYGVQGN